MRSLFIPAYSAALILEPTTRTLKPKNVSRSTNQINTAAKKAKITLQCNRVPAINDGKLANSPKGADSGKLNP
jgi:hypothetical protein